MLLISISHAVVHYLEHAANILHSLGHLVS